MTSADSDMFKEPLFKRARFSNEKKPIEQNCPKEELESQIKRFAGLSGLSIEEVTKAMKALCKAMNKTPIQAIDAMEEIQEEFKGQWEDDIQPNEKEPKFADLKLSTIKGLELLLKTVGRRLPIKEDITQKLLGEVISIAKIAPDNPEYFPHGKWDTIQRLEAIRNTVFEMENPSGTLGSLNQPSVEGEPTIMEL